MYGRVFYFWGWMSTYKKPYLTFQEQLALLKSRGLLVTNDEAALSCLERIGYYRLSAYWYVKAEGWLASVGVNYRVGICYTRS
jgi:abortive infection bacteriophage resistance protein